MDRNVVLGFVVGVATSVLSAWYLRADPETAPPLPFELVDDRGVVVDAIARRQHRPVRRPEQAPAEEPGTFERVVRKIAEYSGEGLIRCEVGDQLPEGPVSGIGRAWVEDGVLVGSVEDPQGQARIQLPGDAMSDPPRLVVRWSEAWPGDTGSCVVLPPKRVVVTGRVVDADGDPVTRAEVGNLVDGAYPVGADGRFAALCWQGAECPLAARHAVGEPFGPFVTVVPEKPTTGVMVVLDRPPAQDLEDYLQERVAEDERLEKQPDPLVLALADPELPAETRPVVEKWLAEEREGRETARQLLAEVGAR